MRNMHMNLIRNLAAVVLVAAVSGGCSIKRLAVNKLGNARGYGMRALEVRYPGFGAALEGDPATALARFRKRDVPLLYWTAAAH